MRTVVLIAALSLCVPLVACGGSSDKPTKSSSTAKKAGPKQPKKLTTKPPDAMSMGTGSEVEPPGGGPSLSVPGGGSATVYSWQTELNDGGDPVDCVGAFASDGSAAIACGPLTDSCEDGSELEAGLLVFFDASENAGAFAIVGSDLCGSGADVIACEFDGDGDVGDCGIGEIDGDKIVVTAEDEDGEDDEE